MSGTGYSPPNDHPIFVAGTALNSSGSGYRGAVGVRVRNIVGWLGDGVELRDTREARPGQDGEYADSQFLGGRTVTFAGVVVGSSYADLQARKKTLAAAWNAIALEEGVIKIPEPDAVAPSFTHSDAMTDFERVTARLSGGGVLFGERFGTFGQRWQVSVRASDPRVYSDVETSADSGTTGTAARTVTVDQGGTYPTPPTLTVTGPTASGWSVTNDSSFSVVFEGLALTSTESVRIRSSDRTATIIGPYQDNRNRRDETVAIWRLNETSGTVADNYEGTATYDGAYNGSPTLNQTGPFSGVPCVSLDGVNDYVQVSYNAALNPSAMTFEAWVNITALPTTGTNLFESQDGTGGWSVAVMPSGELRLSVGNGSGLLTRAISSLTIGRWYHIAVTLDASADTCAMYVDGNRASEHMAFAGEPVSTNAGGVLMFGRNVSASRYLNCKLAAAVLYNIEYPASSIAELYRSTGTLSELNGYEYLVASGTSWSTLGASSTTYRLVSESLTSGSKLNVTYRDARI